MTDTEFIGFMQELVLAPDSVIKKAHMERMLQIVSGLSMYKTATQNEESARERSIKEKDAFIEEMQRMISFLIAFVPDLTDRNKYYDWLRERVTAQKEGV
jgi:hypothetical protein